MSSNKFYYSLLASLGQAAYRASYNATQNHIHRRQTAKALDSLEKKLEGQPANAVSNPPSPMGHAVVDKLCLIHDDATISIPNISRLTLSARNFDEIKRFSNLSRGIAIFGFLALLLGNSISLPVGAAVFAISALIALCLPRAITTKARTLRRLHVHTNDGGEYLFVAFRQEVIDQLRTIITDKMNGSDKSTVYNINFEQGVIQNMGIGNIGSVGAIVSGQGNQVTAGAGNARVNTIETVTSITPVDYSQVLAIVTEWKQHLASQDHKDAAARFADLEQLLKRGTPTQEDRYRLRDLLQDLGSMFSASTQALQLFDTIRKLAGL